MDNQDFSQTLFNLRMQYRLSITDLAALINVSPALINEWEMGKQLPSAEEVRRLANVFSNFRGTNESYSNKSYKDNRLLNKFISYADGGDSINGGSNVKVTFWDLFKDTFKRHKYKGCFKTNEGSNELPMGDNFTKPWIYSRVFIVLLILFGLTFLTKINILINLVGTLVMPLTLFIFLWELNLFCNVKISKAITLFLVGGILSILLTLFINEVVNTPQTLLLSNLATGIIEESAKAIIAYFLIKKLKIRNILPAITIGASVGAGFAYFESVLYAISALNNFGYENMLTTIILRGVYSIGGHTIWAAVSASAIIKVAQRRRVLSNNVFFDTAFLKIFIIPVILHTLWNLNPFGFVGYLIITIIGLTLLIAMINIGLKEVNNIKVQRGYGNY